MLRHVIIGAGEAGVRAAAALKLAGAQAVTLIGGEESVPFERPALSKPDVEGRFHKPIAVDLTGVHLRLDDGALSINREDSRVELSNGFTLQYDRLLLATGARARQLSIDREGAALSLRSLADARAIYARAQAGGKVVIIGAGLIGLEMAAELGRRGMAVTVLEAGPRALARAVPPEIAEVISARHRLAGVDIRFGQNLAALEKDGVLLADGVKLPADLIISAVGTEPETRLAEATGLTCANGILVDGRLCTSDLAIFAAGDCAAVDHPLLGRVRFETWRNARDQGSFAAASMLGASVSFSALPWFWSDQHDLGLQAVGLHDPSRPSVRRDLAGGGFLRFELDGAQRLVAAAGVGPGNAVAKDIRLAEKLIEKRAVCDAAFLADPKANLKAALKERAA
jgi:3-phenylpropionate/trans-cinnamate dioxygenase ferredoxin reductase component